MSRNVQTTVQFYSFHASKVMVKILQARFQQYVNHEIPDVQADFRKDRATRDQIDNIHWIIEKEREFQKSLQMVTAAMRLKDACSLEEKL